MMEDFIADYIARHQLRFSTLSDAIWDTPETRFAETRSSALKGKPPFLKGSWGDCPSYGLRSAVLHSFLLF